MVIISNSQTLDSKTTSQENLIPNNHYSSLYKQIKHEYAMLLSSKEIKEKISHQKSRPNAPTHVGGFLVVIPYYHIQKEINCKKISRLFFLLLYLCSLLVLLRLLLVTFTSEV